MTEEKPEKKEGSLFPTEVDNAIEPNEKKSGAMDNIVQNGANLLPNKEEKEEESSSDSGRSKSSSSKKDINEEEEKTEKENMKSSSSSKKENIEEEESSSDSDQDENEAVEMKEEEEENKEKRVKIKIDADMMKKALSDKVEDEEEQDVASKKSSENSQKSSGRQKNKSDHSYYSVSSSLPTSQTSALSSSRSRPLTSASLASKKKRITYLQEMKTIPNNVKYNPYVMRRYPIYNPSKTGGGSIPHAALSSREYASRDVELGEIAQTLFDGKQLNDETTVDDLKLAANQLRAYEREMVNRGDYLSAKKASNAHKKANKIIFKTEDADARKNSVQYLISKRNELQVLLDSTREEWDDLIREQDSLSRKKLNDMIASQQDDRMNFEENIPSELPPLFKRKSVNYLNMRNREKQLALNKQFDAAMELQKKADILAITEKEENYQKLNKYYRRKRKLLIASQKRSISAYQDYSVTKRNEILSVKEKSLQGLTNRIKNLDKQIMDECEKKNVNPSDLDFEAFNEKRYQEVKSKEQSNPISRRRAVSASLEKKTQQRKRQKNSQKMTPTPNESNQASAEYTSRTKASSSSRTEHTNFEEEEEQLHQEEEQEASEQFKEEEAEGHNSGTLENQQESIAKALVA